MPLWFLASIGACAVLASAPAANAKKARPAIAVLYFDYDGDDAEMKVLRKGLASMFITDLVGLPGIDVVERGRIQEVFAELKLNRSSKVDRKHALKIGKLIGARYLVLGNYFKALGSLVIEARLLDTQTGVYTAVAGREHGPPESFLALQQALSTKIRTKLAKELPQLAKSSEDRDYARSSPGEDRRMGPSKLEKLEARQPRRVRAKKRLRKLSLKVAVKYAQALDAKDKGDLKLARATLKGVLKEAPDFALAKSDLDKLMQ